MNRKFLIYAIVVTVLTTGFSWKQLLAGQVNNGMRTGGSGWSSFMGSGSWAGGSGGHK